MTVCNTLVGNDAQRHDLPFLHSLAVLFNSLLRLSHRDENAGSAELIEMVVNGISPD